LAEIQSKAVRRQALQWDGTENSGYGIAAWVNSESTPEQRAMYQPPQEAAGEKLDQYLTVLTLNGWVVVEPNDWVILDDLGHPYPCNPVVFEARWEVVDA
jgi:hypothetical protein